ncbi:MAG: ATP-binding protein [Chloroflexaceae bacterium]|nr:ATP-binding protein [Chloroflexaceae bacterium]
MKSCLAQLGALLALFVVVIIITAVHDAGGFSFERYNPVAEARQMAELERIERQAAIDRVMTPAYALAGFVMFLTFCGVAVYLVAAWGVAAIRRFRDERRPDVRGLLPVEASNLREISPLALAGYHNAALAAAERPMVSSGPQSLTYAPHYRGEFIRDVTAPAALPVTAGSAGVPTFTELLTAGRIGRGQPLLLGFNQVDGEEIVGSWLDLYATATAGLPGSGKTTSQRFFAAQTALHGARFVICDPHAGAADDSLAATLQPLQRLFLLRPESEPRQILQAVQYVAETGKRRVDGRDSDRTPIVLWVDELTALLGRSDVGDDVAKLLERIAQEYRKKYIYLSASGQIWTAARTSSELRDSLASVLCHRMKRAQARLLLPTEEAAQVERLETGEAILWRTNGATARVRIPNTTAGDIAKVAEILDENGFHQASSGGPPAE